MRHSSFEKSTETLLPESYRLAWRSYCVGWLCDNRAQAFECDPTLLDMLENIDDTLKHNTSRPTCPAIGWRETQSRATFKEAGA